MNIFQEHKKISKKTIDFIRDIYRCEDDEGYEYNPFEDAYDEGYEETKCFLEGCIYDAIMYGYRIAKAEARCLQNE